MNHFLRMLPLVVCSSLVFAACSSADMETMSGDLAVADSVDARSLEQELGLVPQLLRAMDIPQAGITLPSDLLRYVVMSTEQGPIDVDGVRISQEGGGSPSLSELFALSEGARTELKNRDALLLVNVPQEDVEDLCERFQFGHASQDIVFEDGEQLLFTASSVEGRTHALCMMPKFDVDTTSAQPKGNGSSSALADTGGTQNIGWGPYTLAIKKLTCNDPRDWHNWPYNGDEARLRGYRDGADLGLIFSADNMKPGSSPSVNRYIHFNNTAKVELYDFDAFIWNPNDELGEVSMYNTDACADERSHKFHQNSVDYDLTYRIYGPNCPCQQQEQILKSYTAESCSATSSTTTSYSWYCSGGTYWRQAYGTVQYYCTTNCSTYNEACEMKTFVSSALVSARTTSKNNVAIGSPVAVGTCTSGPCGPQYDPIVSAPPDQIVQSPGCLPSLTGEPSEM